MPTDIFGKDIKIAAGPIGRAETFEVYVGNTADVGTSDFLGLAQGIGNTYSRPLQRIYDLASHSTFTVSGRTMGTLTINRLVGKSHGDIGSSRGGARYPTASSFLRSVNTNPFFELDGNRGGTVVFKERTTGASWVCSGCYISQQGVTVETNGILVTENIVIEYQKLREKQVFPRSTDSSSTHQGDPSYPVPTTIKDPEVPETVKEAAAKLNDWPAHEATGADYRDTIIGALPFGTIPKSVVRDAITDAKEVIRRLFD
jgi:hypothetical protein